MSSDRIAPAMKDYLLGTNAARVVRHAMWFCHLLLFSGTSLSSWIGLLVVVQNIVSSLLNSHLFDFHEGWLYVLGVGVAGGTALKMRVERGESHVGKAR